MIYSEKKNAYTPISVYMRIYLRYPYVGIIQIRFPGRDYLSPLSLLCKLPVLFICQSYSITESQRVNRISLFFPVRVIILRDPLAGSHTCIIELTELLFRFFCEIRRYLYLYRHILASFTIFVLHRYDTFVFQTDLRT